jgi:hypothetical protein
LAFCIIRRFEFFARLEKGFQVKLYFNKPNGPVDGAIDQLLRLAEGIRRPEYIREMIIAALKAARRTTKARTSSL